MSLTLQKNLETGVAKIDKQHRDLISTINKLIEMSVKSLNKETIKDTLDMLGEYVIEHFNDEETLQIVCNYPNYSEHKAQHDEFVRNFLRLKYDFNDFECHYSEFTLDLIEVVATWIVKHIKGSDVEMGKYCRNYLLNRYTHHKHHKHHHKHHSHNQHSQHNYNQHKH
jgi:hemerythrin